MGNLATKASCNSSTLRDIKDLVEKKILATATLVR